MNTIKDILDRANLRRASEVAVIKIDEIDTANRQLFPEEVAKLGDWDKMCIRLTPITVRRVGDRYMLIDGLFRIEAMKKLGGTEIIARIFS